jgi:hypothetical protein
MHWSINILRNNTITISYITMTSTSQYCKWLSMDTIESHSMQEYSSHIFMLYMYEYCWYMPCIFVNIASMLYCMYDEIYAMFTFTVMLAYVCMPKIVFSRQNEISNDEIQTMLVYQYIYIISWTYHDGSIWLATYV